MSKVTGKRDYSILVKDIGRLLEAGRKKTYQTVNAILVRTEIGKSIVEQQEKFGWGKSVESLSKDLHTEYSGIKGFLVQLLVGGWASNLIIRSKCKGVCGWF